MGVRLTTEQRQLARRLRAKGLSNREIGREIGTSYEAIRVLLHKPPSLADEMAAWTPRPSHLSLEERERILVGLGQGLSLRSIAAGLGRSPSTVSREVAANGGSADYGAFAAHCTAHKRARRPKAAKLVAGPLLQAVAEMLGQLWSPREISGRLALDHPSNPAMHVSHETIYQSLFVQGRGELRRELARCLRSGRTARKPHGHLERRGKLIDMVLISERPAEVADRAVPGHWEGDLILGAGSKSAVGTLVERSTRFVLLLHLPAGKDADAVEVAMRKAIRSLPGELIKTVTWDQGKEMANHAKITIQTKIPIYFCDPHSPWQRGSNENTNGLLRQYLPKGMDLSGVTAKDLQTIQRSLNGRPRETLGFMTPSEKFAEAVALTG